MTGKDTLRPSGAASRRRPVAFPALTVLAALVLQLASGFSQSATLYENAAVIAGNGQFLPQADVLVAAGQIVAVGDRSTFDLSEEETRRIDLSGKFLMPAMIDGHCHLGYQGPGGWGGAHYSEENLVANLRQYAYYGFSAAFSAGSDADGLAFALSADQEKKYPDAARMLFAAGMAPPGSGPYDAFIAETRVIEANSGMRVLRAVGGPEDAITQVKAVAREGYDFIKIWVDDRGGGQDKLAEAVYRPLIAEASRLGIPVVAHQQAPADMPPLIDAGISGFIHGRLGPDLDARIALAAADRRTFIIPNLGLAELRRETIGRDPFLKAVLPEAKADSLSTSTDERKVQPRWDRAREAGLRASMASLVDASPLDDIRNTRAIHAVYLGGRRIDRESIAQDLRQR